MTACHSPQNDTAQEAADDPQSEARVFAALEDAARRRAVEDAQDPLVLTSPRAAHLSARIRAWWQRARRG